MEEFLKVKENLIDTSTDIKEEEVKVIAGWNNQGKLQEEYVKAANGYFDWLRKEGKGLVTYTQMYAVLYCYKKVTSTKRSENVKVKDEEVKRVYLEWLKLHISEITKTHGKKITNFDIKVLSETLVVRQFLMHNITFATKVFIENQPRLMATHTIRFFLAPSRIKKLVAETIVDVEKLKNNQIPSNRRPISLYAMFNSWKGFELSTIEFNEFLEEIWNVAAEVLPNIDKGLKTRDGSNDVDIGVLIKDANIALRGKFKSLTESQKKKYW